MKTTSLVIALIFGIAVMVGVFLPWVSGMGFSFSGWDMASLAGMFDESLPEVYITFVGGIAMVICSIIAITVSLAKGVSRGAIRTLRGFFITASIVAIVGLIWFIVHLYVSDGSIGDVAYGFYISAVSSVVGLIAGITAFRKPSVDGFVRQRPTWDSIDTRREGNLCTQCGLESPPSAKFCPSCGIEFYGEEKLARARASELLEKLNVYTALTCSCGTCFRVPPDHEGNSIKCPWCGKDNTIIEVTCPKCGSKNLPTAKFCCSCGAEVVRENKSLCQNCGEVNPPNASFCTSCGSRLGLAQAVQQKPPEPTKSVDSDSTEFEGEIFEAIVCPKCGSKTVIRTVVKGPNKGLKFHVCVRFPECKGRILAEESLF